MIYKRGKIYWYKFVWRGALIRESTKLKNQRLAEQIESAHKTALAKGEVGIRVRKPVPTLTEFSERHFLPFVRTTFKEKVKTRQFYENGAKNLVAFERLAEKPMTAITNEDIAAYGGKRQKEGLQISSINRELQALRRMFALAEEWGTVDQALPKVKMLPGERHRERVLTPEEEDAYFAAAKSDAMKRFEDPDLLHDVAALMIDCDPRNEECERLRVENVRDDVLEILFGKSDNARRRIPMTPRVKAVVDMRLQKTAGSEWLFPRDTKSGHIEPSSLKKQHAKALRVSGVAPFELYTLRHTCLTRWAPYMDPWTLAYLAGHRDMNTTKRYIHPQEHTVREAMERARGGHKIGHSAENGAQTGTEQVTAIQ